MEGWDGTGGGSIFREGFGRELVWFGVEKFVFFYFLSPSILSRSQFFLSKPIAPKFGEAAFMQ